MPDYRALESLKSFAKEFVLKRSMACNSLVRIDLQAQLYQISQTVVPLASLFACFHIVNILQIR